MGTKIKSLLYRQSDFERWCENIFQMENTLFLNILPSFIKHSLFQRNDADGGPPSMMQSSRLIFRMITDDGKRISTHGELANFLTPVLKYNTNFVYFADRSEDGGRKFESYLDILPDRLSDQSLYSKHILRCYCGCDVIRMIILVEDLKKFHHIVIIQ